MDGFLEQVLRVFDLAPGESRNLAFLATCALDQELDVVCDLVISPVGDPDSVAYACSAFSTVKCFVSCCEQLFVARNSTAVGNLPAYFDAAQAATIRGEGDQFFIRGSCSSTGEWVADDELHVESTAFLGHGEDKGIGFPVGVPIETVWNPVGVVEVTDAIPSGENLTIFRLQDAQGSVFGNTDVYLIKTSSASVTGVDVDAAPIAPRFAVRAIPNPSNGVVRLWVEGADDADVYLSVLDIQGRLIRDFGVVRGSVQWDGTGHGGTRVASGMYVVSAKGGERQATSKVFVLR